LYDSEESSSKARFVAGAGTGFHWISLKIQKASSEMERNLEKVVKEVDDHRLR
jgi:hypothetical protein